MSEELYNHNSRSQCEKREDTSCEVNSDSWPGVSSQLWNKELTNIGEIALGSKMLLLALSIRCQVDKGYTVPRPGAERS
jgi:hypothetical protein